MILPTVTETTRPPQPVDPDPFVDDVPEPVVRQLVPPTPPAPRPPRRIWD